MGLLRVSDDAERKIKKVANGRTIVSVVDSILAEWGAADFSALEEKLSSLENRLDGMAVYLEKRFSKLESLIEDTTVERVGKGGAAREYLDWDVFRYLAFDLCRDEDAPEWCSKAIYNYIQNNDDDLTTFVQGNYICEERPNTHPTQLLKITPRVKQAIAEGRRYA